jgi:hypothetical protein
MRSSSFALAAVIGIALFFIFLGASPSASTVTTAELARGHSLVAFGGCNDCHTPGWRESDGTIPPKKWMTGSPIGFRGPWGTVYPANVRQRFAMVDEGQWLSMVRTRAGHPPMTWHDLRNLNVADQRAIYRFIRSLGVAGPPSRPDVPPGVVPKTPYYDVTPTTPPPG